jgi:hypothetical protein
LNGGDHLLNWCGRAIHTDARFILHPIDRFHLHAGKPLQGLFDFPFAPPSRHPRHREPDLSCVRHGVLLSEIHLALDAF